jgi:hypothetical protein
MNAPTRPFAGLAVTAILMLSTGLTLSTGMVSAATPRSERVAARMAERAYARQSIAEARAARAEARVAEIAPLVPVPPPPRPATVRRMARAGVPPRGAMPPAVVTTAPPAAVSTPPATPPAVAVQPAQPSPAASPSPAPAAVSPDGTRSVLAAAEEPAAAAADRKPAGPAVTHPPIELLPTPQPQ